MILLKLVILLGQFMNNLAFDTSKCNIPAIPKITELQLQDCNVPSFRNPLRAFKLLPSPLSPLGVGAAPISSLISYGQAITDIPVNGTGTVTVYNCGVLTSQTVTVTSRFRSIRSGEFVYFFRFGCGNEVFGAQTLTFVGYGVLLTALAAGSLSAPTTATLQLYNNNNGNLTASSSTITLRNPFSTIRGNVGDSVEFIGVENLNTAFGVPINAIQSTSGVATTTTTGAAVGCCHDCIDPATLTGTGNKYQLNYTVSQIPATLGGDGAGLVYLTWISDQVWESDSFHFACAGGTDAYFWRYTTIVGSYDVANSCSNAPGSATLTLVKVATTLHCSDLTSKSNSRNAVSGTIPYVYKNINPIRYQCGSTLVIGPDICMADELNDQLPCTVCIYPTT